MSGLKKKCLVVILPTNEKSNIYLNQYADSKNKADKLVLGSSISNELTSSVTDLISRGYQPQHLHVLSDDLIRDENWFVRLFDNTICKANVNFDHNVYNCKKIIATTNDSLKIRKCDYPKCGGYQNTGQGECGECLIELPTTSKEFIHKYINTYNAGNPITEIMVEYEILRHREGNLGFETDYQLKVNFSNEISITKVKENYSRQEVLKIAELAWNTALDTTDGSDTFPMGGNTYKHPTFDDFVKENF